MNEPSDTPSFLSLAYGEARDIAPASRCGFWPPDHQSRVEPTSLCLSGYTAVGVRCRQDPAFQPGDVQSACACHLWVFSSCGSIHWRHTPNVRLVSLVCCSGMTADSPSRETQTTEPAGARIPHRIVIRLTELDRLAQATECGFPSCLMC